MFARHGSHFLPQATQMLHLVHRGGHRLFIQVSQQVFGLFAEQQLLLQVVLASLFLNVELVTATGKEVVASIAELLVEIHVFKATESKFAPFLLEFANGVGQLVAASAFGKLTHLVDHRGFLFLDDIETLGQCRIRMGKTVENLVVDRIVTVADFFDGFLRNHADGLPFFFHSLEFVKSSLGSGFHRFELFAQSLLRFQVLRLGCIHFLEMGSFLFEEAVAGGTETSPDFIGLALGHRTDRLPGILQLL